MFDPTTAIPTPGPRASIYFDDAGEVGRCGEAEFEISERGLRFTSPRNFTIGTQLGVAVNHMHSRLGLCRLQLEGIVVWCEPRGERSHETTLLFLEFPDEIRPSLREFSHSYPVA